MLERLLRRFAGAPKEEPLPELDARLAVGALLVRLAKADADYAFEEIAQIDKLLAERQDLSPIEAAKLRATCEKLEAAAPDTKTFTAMVQEDVSYAERAALFDALWLVSVADRALRPEEEAFLAEAAQALAIRKDDADAAAAFHKV